MITVSGPPSSGKTSMLIKTAEHLREKGISFGIVKFDCISTCDREIYEKAGIPCAVGLSGNLCPDHYFISNIEECESWGRKQGFDLLITESAGLCNRCSPHIREVPAICVIDCLSGVHTPQKVGPMLRLADLVAVTKGDIVSQAEREVFSYKIKQINRKARLLMINGITGQGTFDLARAVMEKDSPGDLRGKKLRFTMPAALCSYCFGETRIGESCQVGDVRKITFPESKETAAV